MMIRFPVLMLLAAGLAVAQTPGAWRRVGDPPPATAEAQPQSNPEPVDRSDQFGQPAPAQAPDGTAGQAPDDAAAPAPAAAPVPTPAPAPQVAPPRNDRPAYGLPRELTLRPGTYISMRINQPLSSDRNHEGDTFTGSLMQPVVVDGVVVALRGQTVYGRVSEAQKAGRVEGTSRLGVQLTQLTLVDGDQAAVQSQMVTRNGPTSQGRDAAAIGGTTALGAIVGAGVNGGVGAGVGAGAGAVVGIIGVMLTRGRPTVIYPESVLTFRLSDPITISTERAPQAFHFVNTNGYSRASATQGPPPPAGWTCKGYGWPPPVATPPPYYYYPYYPYPWGVGLGLWYGPGFYGRGFYGRGFYRR